MFTDEDLKRLKEDMTNKLYVSGNYMPNPGILEALLARLEAGEAVIHRLEASKDLQDFGWFVPTNEEYKSWRKAAGKES